MLGFFKKMYLDYQEKKYNEWKEKVINEYKNLPYSEKYDHNPSPETIQDTFHRT